MDFNDSPTEAQFRSEVRAWLAVNAAEYREPLAHDLNPQQYAASSRAWQKKKASAGYAAISWSREHGGLDGTPMQEVIFAEEESRYHVPVSPLVTIGTQLAVPTIRVHGTPEQIEKFARPTLLGDLLWCQLFSEPAAGSDLAGLRTRAVRTGKDGRDDWIINGQKVWTSWAHTADWGILLARTDTEVAKHKGLTFFLLDMRTPGVEVRPIRQLSGVSEFNEVFLTDVRIPDANRLGAVGAGWKVTMTTLMNERISSMETHALPSVSDALQYAAAHSKAATPYRQQLARWFAREQGLKYFRARQLTALSNGKTPGAIGAMSKLVYANLLQDMCAAAIDIGSIDAAFPAPEDYAMRKFQHGYFWSAALRIAGGTDEILRNQIAERVLGLPGEIRIDKDLPFSQLPVGEK